MPGIYRILYAWSAICSVCGANVRGHGQEPPNYSIGLYDNKRIDLCNRCAVEIAQRIMQDLAESKL